VVNFDLGEQFPRPRSQQRGSLRPCARHVAVLGVGAGGGRPLLLRRPGGITPNFFLEIFDAKSRIWGQFGPQPNEYDVIFPERFSVSIPPVTNDICWSAVPAPKYLPERRSTAFPHHYTPGWVLRTYVHLLQGSRICCWSVKWWQCHMTVALNMCSRLNNTDVYQYVGFVAWEVEEHLLMSRQNMALFSVTFRVFSCLCSSWCTVAILHSILSVLFYTELSYCLLRVFNCRRTVSHKLI